MVDIKDKHKCTGCTACASICLKNAITIKFDDCGHSYPTVDKSICIDCGACDKVCPLLHKEVYELHEENMPIYAVYNRDETIRAKSTSGGVFSVLSEYVINNGGIVYAARFDSDFHILHDGVESVSDLESYRGSKYAQSDLTGIFRSVKSSLMSRMVLFVGTPCQVAGLKSYLRKEYDNLITCDFICMGISSPVVWEDYLNSYWNKDQINKVFFKDKRNGWHNYRMLIEDKSGEHLCKGDDNPFFASYLNHYSYRPSCFECIFRHIQRVSDFTIADCWGIDKYNKEFDDNKGCTTLILQSSKSQLIFNCLKDNLKFIEYPVDMVKKHNPYSCHQIAMNHASEQFFRIRNEKGLKKAFEFIKMDIGDMHKVSLFGKIKNKLKNILKHG